MKERIILTSNNQTELLRTIAKYNENTLGLYAPNEREFAQFVLDRSGIYVDKKWISEAESAAVIYSFLRDIPYFEVASYRDALRISKTLNEIGSYIEEDEEETFKKALKDSEFKEKNEALLECYKEYHDYLNRNNRIDTNGLLRVAIEKGKQLDIEVVICKEYPISPLFKKCAETCVKEIKETSLLEIFNKEEKDGVIDYTQAYGITNELQHIYSTIYENKNPLDTCLIVCASPSNYIQQIYDDAMLYKIPMTFGCGIPIHNAYPAQFVELLNAWNTSGYNGIASLEHLINHPSFSKGKLIEEIEYEDIERIIERAGSLRLSFDADTNKERLNAYEKIEEDKEFFQALRIFSNELELGFIPFTKKYAKIREDNALDSSALLKITSTLETYLEYVVDGSVEDILDIVLGANIRREISKSGAMHVTDMNNAYASMREHVFICGLSAAEFPRAPKENYLIFDEELLNIHKDAKTSDAIVHEEIDALQDLISFANSLDSDIHLSYANYNLATLKEQNPSSVLFDIFEKREGGDMDAFRNQVKNVEYFEKPYMLSDAITKAYMNDEEITYNPIENEMLDSKKALEKAWSPSSLEAFFSCPRRFYLTRILGIPDEEEDDPLTIISPADVGTLAHSMMEDLKEKKYSKKDFLKEAEKKLDAFFIGRPPIHDAEKEKQDFLKMMEFAYEDDPKRESVSTEKGYYAEHESGVKLYGIPDSVEIVDDESNIIVDYKTKRILDHVEDDIETCLQVVIYAYLCEANNIPIDHCEYRYFRKRRSVSCKYDEGMKQALNKKLEEFKDALKNNNFPRTDSKDNCKYCTLGDVCLWKNDAIEEEVNEDE